MRRTHCFCGLFHNGMELEVIVRFLETPGLRKNWRAATSPTPHPVLVLLAPRAKEQHCALVPPDPSFQNTPPVCQVPLANFPAYVPFFPDSCPLQFNKHTFYFIIQVDNENTKQCWFLGRPQSINILPFLEWAHWASWIVFWPLLDLYHACIINNAFGMFVKVICQKFYWIPVRVLLLPEMIFLSV